MTDAPHRGQVLDELASTTFDLLVIGGGITGAGIVRNAARRGLRVGLLEARDFASGTSSRSSKLIHGGLRYLAMGDVSLVRETALERKEVFRLAPHLAEPRWMVLPIRSRAGLLKFRFALTTYEKLGAVEDADIHRNWGQEEIAIEEPLLRTDPYAYACSYREYVTDDARLVLANLRSAVQRGAVVLNHVHVDGFAQENGRVTGVEARCTESGRELRVSARCVVNATGPWVENVRRLREPDMKPWLHLSKGVHVGIPSERLPIRNIVVMNPGDGRTVFAIPRDGVVYVGTTDTTHEGGPETWPRITLEDVRYLVDPLSKYFDTPPVGPEDVVTAWAGLRPLIAEPGKKPKDLSRKDEIHVGAGGLISIAGGKLTGYRPMAASVLDKVAEALGKSLPEAQGEPVLPGGDFEGDLSPLVSELEGKGLCAHGAVRLARLYGTECRNVLALGGEPLVPGTSVVAGEVDWAVRNEWAANLEDLIYRRLRAAIYEPAAREKIVEPAAARMAALLNWDEERTRREVADVSERLNADLAFDG